MSNMGVDVKKEVIDYLENEGVLFGSIVFGGHHELSDIDILITKQKFDALSLSPEEYIIGGSTHGFDKVSGPMSHYVYRNDVIYNICVCETDEIYEVWTKATDIMRALIKNERIAKRCAENKGYRIDLFTTLRNGLESSKNINS